MYTVSATGAAIMDGAAVKDLLLASLNETSMIALARLAEAAPCT